MANKVDMIIFLILLFASASSTQVDNLNILLPELHQAPPTLPLQLITAQAGCYDWNSSLPQYLQVNPYLPISSGCSRQAVISVGKLGSYASTIYVSAIDGASQSTLNIPVRIRKISKITIASKSRMMNIKELQKLQLFGYDADGNTFTSLQGLRFIWQLDQDTQIIQNVQLQNSNLFFPLKTRQNLQKRGYQSDILVVRAIAPGNLKVKVKCIEPGYQKLIDEITISVHERFQLSPGPIIYIAAETSFQLKLIRPNLEEIMLPQPYYRVISCNKFIINSTLYLTVPNYESTCTIRIQDTRTKPAYQSSVEIRVLKADQLKILTDPLVIVGKQSAYQVQLYRNGDPLLGNSRNIIYYSDFYLNKEAKTLVASKKGSGYLSAELGQLKKSVIINALLPVRILLPEHYIHLPVEEHFKLRVLGGTGVYDFQISSDIASINTMTVLHAKQIGETTIVIKDRNHAANQIVVRLKISDISKIYSLEENKQTNRDEWAYFYVLAQNSGKQSFTQCQSAQFSLSVPTANLDIDPKVNFIQSVSFLQFQPSQIVQEAIAPTSLLKGRQFEIIDSFKKYVDENQITSQDLKNYILNLQNYGICKALRFKSIISFEQKALIALQGETDVKTIVPLRVYDIIQTTIQEDNNLFLMTPDSSLNWTYTGGSYRWPTSKTLTSVNGQFIGTINPIIQCPEKQMSSKTYELKVYNEQTRSLLFPVSQTTTISLVCKFPRKLHLSLHHGEIYDELYIEKQTEIKGLVKATDQLSQQFYNSSNVIYEFSTLNGIVSNIGDQFHYQSVGKNDTLSIFTEKLKNSISFSKVTINIDISLAEPVVIAHPLGTNKKQMTIVTLFTPKKPYVLHLTHMHSQLQLQCTNAISCQKGQNYIAVKLLKLGKGSLHLKDKKIYGSQDWHFQFVIVQPDEVRINANKDYLQQGEILEVNVTNYFNGNEISPFTYEPSYLNLILPSNLRIVEQNIQLFKVRAEKAGTYHIHGQSNYPSVKKTKYPLNITVYKRISLNIDDLTSKQQKDLYILEAKTALVVGCRRFLRIEGGPRQLTSKIVFSQDNLKINHIDNRTLQLSGNKQGFYTFTAKIYYKKYFIAEIHGEVTVNKLQKMQIQTIQQPVVGAHFRIHPKFKIGDLNLEELYCDYTYHWKITSGLIELGESFSFGLLDATAINATAKKTGTEIITFEVQEKSGGIVLKQTRSIEILQDIALVLPTYINKVKCQPNPTSIIMAPNTKRVFNGEIKIKSDQGIVHVGHQSNLLESGKKLGHSTIKLSQPGHRSMHVEVEVKQIMGIFIDNQQGFISIEPNSEKRVQIYLQDNYGRLFFTPLQNLEILVSSSNIDLVQTSLSQSGDALILKSTKQGVCIVYVKIPSRNIIDSIAVSVGSAILPGKEIKVCKNGIVKFNTTSSQALWSSDNKQVVTIEPASGLARAVGIGKTKVNYGQLSSLVFVLEIAKVEQVGQEIYKGSTMQIQYKLFWLVNNKYEEISNIQSAEAINNNLDLSCIVNDRYLTTKAFIKENQGHQRLICQVSLQKVDKWPESFAVRVKDTAGSLEAKQFYYKFTPLFTLDKKQIHLNPDKYQSQLLIKSPRPLQVAIRNGKPKWIVESIYDEKKKQQKVSIDMKGQQSQSTWYLDVSLQGQQEQIKVSFKLQGGGQKSHEFWSISMDWPDYLIIIMGVVFFVICYFQYVTETKIKNT